MPRVPIALTALALALQTLAMGAAQAAPDAIFQELEEEKLVDNVYKAYFPNLATARKAAITFHAQLLETDYKRGFLVLQLDAADMDRLRGFGFRLERAADFIQRRNQALTGFQIAHARRMAGAPEPKSIPGYACYETVEETFAVGDAFIAAKPTLAAWASAGSSWLKTQGSGGYDMKVLRLTNRAITGDKPKLLVNSAIHAREYTTAPLVLEFARWLVNGYGVNADATWILDHHEVHLMLHTNPDGRKRAEAGLSWRKNVNNNHCSNSNNRGVDLNRNFSFTWNSTGGVGSSGSACNLTYRGPTAGSEPETRALEAYVRSLWPDRRGPGLNDAAPADTSGIHLDIHSYSQLVLWPWGEVDTPAPNGPALQTLGRRLAWFNGYTPQQSIGLYPTDGTSDAPSYGELGVASFTIELGTSFFESCTSYNNGTKPTNLPALIYAAKVVRTPYITPGGPDITALSLGSDASGAGVTAGTSVALAASATDTRFNQSNGTEAVQAINAARYSIDLPPWEASARLLPLQATDGVFNSSTEALQGSIKTNDLGLGKHIVYVQARDAGGTWGPVTAAFLNIVPPGTLQLAEVEPNDFVSNAQPVPQLPALVSGYIATADEESSDSDHFRITLAAGQSFTAALTSNAGSDYNLELLDGVGRVIGSSIQPAGQVDTLRTTNRSAFDKRYVVRVVYASGGVGPTQGTYTLALTQP